MIRVDAATVLLQWSAGGLFFLWFTTRRREVGVGYGWLLRGTFLLLALLAAVLGLEFDHIRAVYLRIPGGGFVELLEYVGAERLPAASRPCDYGAGHLCLYVDDVEALHARLVGLGFAARSPNVVDITAGPNQGARSCYMADPDGYAVELFQKRPGA